jgi:hypothetical protein
MATRSLESLRFYHPRAWNPADGPGAARQQRLPPPAAIRSDGSTARLDADALWAPSQGPSRHETGGAGGEPSGHSIAIRKECWD